MKKSMNSKFLIDTNIYIDFINTNKYREWVFVRDYPTRLFLSAIVLMELYAGAHNRSDIKLVDTIKEPFAKRNMIIAPTIGDYITAGEILADLQKLRGYELKKSYWLTNDVLIALSARRIGATVVTQNRRDFEEIQQIKGFSLQLVAY
ncbi:type II toxin-antitoxin system VapC family toxin [Candidatus Poribacteria bacterium]|nr:type II toxin-antitoxin system VapC family toxin [Candidatus Poribacteria bacterium]